MLKIEFKFQNAEKNSKNIFGFWDICRWKCYNKFPLWWREYLSSKVNELRNSPKILHISKRDLFKLNCFRLVYHVISQRVLWKGNFQTFLSPRFLESVSLKIHQPWGPFFASKCSILNLNFGNAEKKLGNIFRFWDNFIWKCCSKLPLLKRE